MTKYLKHSKDWILLALLISAFALFVPGCLETNKQFNKPVNPIFDLSEASADYCDNAPECYDGLRFGSKLRITQLEMDVIYNRAKAIACQEGYYAGNTVAWRNHSPGNLKAGGLTDSQRHTIYYSHVEGWLALYEYLYQRQHLSIYQIGKTYAQDPNWAKGVIRCSRTQF